MTLIELLWSRTAFSASAGSSLKLMVNVWQSYSAGITPSRPFELSARAGPLIRSARTRPGRMRTSCLMVDLLSSRLLPALDERKIRGRLEFSHLAPPSPYHLITSSPHHSPLQIPRIPPIISVEARNLGGNLVDTLSLDIVFPNPNQPRKMFDET